MRNKLVFFFCLLALAGCGGGAGKRGGSVTIATLKGPSSMGMIQYIDSVDNAPHSNVKVMILNEPMQVRKMMLDGTADFAVLPTTMAAVLYNKGLDYKMVSVPVWGTFYLFGNDSTVKGWDDLRGKRVNVMARGMTPDALFRYLLERNGLDPERDLTLDYSFPTHIDLANAVAAERVSLGVVSEPYVSLAMRKNNHIHIILDLNAEWNKVQGIPIAETAFIGKDSVLKSDAGFVKKLEAAYAYSTKWVNEHPDSAAVLMVKYGLLPDVATARSSIPRSNLEYVSARGIEREIGDYLNIFYELNPEFVGGKIPDENFYYEK
ncbi:MAG: ABC transporter substrate-binding protein [Bacteroidales bacterium]|jgi:NitT/TauT family transport system substrate-binding protein|nr:ABC transporter substrate-binding protein [Bacteroidales bacterium]MCI2121694.1 ABC transporter substrate-binding protein [Bacteroidales bacterium]MCI2144881.1 ABC transporter substrate-binding protein [Bacteroidales bacterium]